MIHNEMMIDIGTKVNNKVIVSQ